MSRFNFCDGLDFFRIMDFNLWTCNKCGFVGEWIDCICHKRLDIEENEMKEFINPGNRVIINLQEKKIKGTLLGYNNDKTIVAVEIDDYSSGHNCDKYTYYGNPEHAPKLIRKPKQNSGLFFHVRYVTQENNPRPCLGIQR